jgi:hypothetical protein
MRWMHWHRSRNRKLTASGTDQERKHYRIPSLHNKVQQKRRNAMPAIHLHKTTNLTPEQCIAGLTDIGPGRAKLFPKSADEYLTVHQQSRTEADVTEGSGGV